MIENVSNQSVLAYHLVVPNRSFVEGTCGIREIFLSVSQSTDLVILFLVFEDMNVSNDGFILLR